MWIYRGRWTPPVFAFLVLCALSLSARFAGAQSAVDAPERTAARTLAVSGGSLNVQFFQDLIEARGVALVAGEDPQQPVVDGNNAGLIQLHGTVPSGSLSIESDDAASQLQVTARTAFILSDENRTSVYSPLTMLFDLGDGRGQLMPVGQSNATDGPVITATVAGWSGVDGLDDRGYGEMMISGDLLLEGAMIGQFDLSIVTAPGNTRKAAGVTAGTVAGGIGPDLIIDQIGDVRRWGWVNGATGYSLWTKACNIGDQNAVWYAGTDQKPIIAQNMYRLKDGRLMQIGMSWVKHGFFADNDQCEESGNCIGDPTGSELPPMCADSYSTQLNGAQINLGPRYEVNPTTGQHIYPFETQGFSGDATYKRIQAVDDMVDPAVNPTEETLYIVEAHYVSPDDAAAGNQDNNASYAPLLRIESPEVGVYDAIGPAGGTTRIGLPAIYAWEENDLGVTVEVVDIPGDRRVLLAYKVTDLGGGTWHYEYAIQNLNSDRSVGEFFVPTLDADAIGFYDIDEHSGDGSSPFGSYYANEDWQGSHGCGGVSWSSEPYWLNERANAIRWGSMFNFWFDSNQEPVEGTVTLGMFKPGDPTHVDVTALVPAFPTLGVTDCLPGDRFIDPRQPSAPDGTDPQGFDALSMSFSDDAMNILATHFMTGEEGADGVPVGIQSISNPESDVIDILFDDLIDPGAWTLVTFTPTGQTSRLGFLPGDVNGSGTSNGEDIRVLINMLSLPASDEAVARGDIDRNDQVEPEDLLRTIDLLNGGGNYQPYFGTSLP